MQIFPLAPNRKSRKKYLLYSLLITSFILVILIGSSSIKISRAAGGVISVCDESHLIQAVNSGGSYTFSCSGTITLKTASSNGMQPTSDLTLDATGQNITIDGGQTHRLFYIPSNVKFILKNLTLTHGNSTLGFGGAIYIDKDSEASIYNSTFSYNNAQQAGGAIDSRGKLTLVNTIFLIIRLPPLILPGEPFTCPT